MTVIINIIRKHYPIFIFLVFYLVLSFLFYKDFGITADEDTEYISTRLLKQMLFDNASRDYLYSKGWNYNPLEAPYSRAHLLIHILINTKNYYEWNHLINLILGSAAFILIYLFIYKALKSKFAAISAVLLLFLTPRFTGDLPGNPKDIPFAIMYTLSLFAIYYFGTTKNKPIIEYLSLAVLIGITQSTRILGLTLLIIYAVFNLKMGLKDSLTLDNIKKSLMKTTYSTIFVGIGSIIVMVGFLPSLWESPVRNFIRLIAVSSTFDLWNHEILFMGSMLDKYNHPIIYLPIWFLITTPLHTLIPLILSVIYVKRFIKIPIYFLLLISVLINFTVYFSINPIIYNGIRHFLFLVPIFIMLAVIFLNDLYSTNNRKLFITVVSIFTIYLLFTLIRMIHLHPFEYIYFNELTGGLKNTYDAYETDYWGASYKEGTQWVIDHRKEFPKVLKVYPCNVSNSVWYFGKGSFEMVNESRDADLILCDYERTKQRDMKLNILGEIKRENAPLLYIGTLTK